MEARRGPRRAPSTGHGQRSTASTIWPYMVHIWPYMAIYGHTWSIHGHIWAIYELYISRVQPTVQATNGPCPISRKWGAAAKPPPPHFLDIGYGPSAACTVGCTWLMCSLCMAHIWPMYDLYMAYIWPYVHICQVTLPGFLSMLIWCQLHVLRLT